MTGGAQRKAGARDPSCVKVGCTRRSSKEPAAHGLCRTCFKGAPVTGDDGVALVGGSWQPARWGVMRWVPE